MPEFFIGFSSNNSMLQGRKVEVVDGAYSRRDIDYFSYQVDGAIHTETFDPLSQRSAMSTDNRYMVFVGCWNSDKRNARLFRSDDYGETFTHVSSMDSYFDDNPTTNLVRDGSSVYYLKGSFFLHHYGSSRLFKSTDNGVTWTNIGNPFFLVYSGDPLFYPVYYFDDEFIIARINYGAYQSGELETNLLYSTDGRNFSPLWDESRSGKAPLVYSLEMFRSYYKETSTGKYVFPFYTWDGPVTQDLIWQASVNTELLQSGYILFHAFEEALYGWSATDMDVDGSLEVSTDYGNTWSTVNTNLGFDYPGQWNGESVSTCRFYYKNKIAGFVGDGDNILTVQNDGADITGFTLNLGIHENADAVHPLITDFFGAGQACGVSWKDVENAEVVAGAVGLAVGTEVGIENVLNDTGGGGLLLG